MKRFIIIFLCTLISFASAKDSKFSQKEIRKQEALQQAIEQEKKFAKEQKFYKYEDYDFKSSEVNEDSFKKYSGDKT